MLLFLVVVISLFSYTVMRKTADRFADIVSIKEAKLKKWSNLVRMISDSKDRLYKYKAGNSEITEPLILLVNKALKEVEEIQEITDEKEELDSIDKIIKEMKTFRQAIFSYQSEISEGYGGGTSAQEMEEIALNSADSAAQLSYAILDFIGKRIEKDNKAILQTVYVSQRILSMFLISAIVFTVIVALSMGRALAKPIRNLVQATQRIARGNLTQEIEINSHDEFGILSQAFNQMMRDLRTSKDKLDETIDAERRKAKELRRAYEKLKRTQDLLIQAERLNAVGKLASGVAHEVKNPLGVIAQGINYLEKRIPARQEETFEIVKLIKESIKRADNIVRSLLDFSKVTNLSLKPEDINSILEHSLTLLKQKIQSQKIEIIKEMRSDIPMVLVDRNKIEQVFINIFLNAIQAMSEGGKIIIRSYDEQLVGVKNGIGRRAEDHFNLGERAVTVEIKDTGAGISEENLKRIFNPFFTTKGKSGGTGLGLSVSRNIITMHRGLMKIESQEGKGTNVIITLKIAEKE
jgi:two-component system NtrC family sensor kinase